MYRDRLIGKGFDGAAKETVEKTDEKRVKCGCILEFFSYGKQWRILKRTPCGREHVNKVESAVLVDQPETAELEKLKNYLRTLLHSRTEYNTTLESSDSLYLRAAEMFSSRTLTKSLTDSRREVTSLERMASNLIRSSKAARR